MQQKLLLSFGIRSVGCSHCLIGHRLAARIGVETKDARSVSSAFRCSAASLVIGAGKASALVARTQGPKGGFYADRSRPPLLLCGACYTGFTPYELACARVIAGGILAQQIFLSDNRAAEARWPEIVAFGQYRCCYTACPVALMPVWADTSLENRL